MHQFNWDKLTHTYTYSHILTHTEWETGREREREREQKKKHTHIYTHRQTQTYTNTQTYINTYIHTYIHSYTYRLINTHTHTHTYTHIYRVTLINADKHTQALTNYIPMHLHTHTQLCELQTLVTWSLSITTDINVYNGLFSYLTISYWRLLRPSTPDRNFHVFSVSELQRKHLLLNILVNWSIH